MRCFTRAGLCALALGSTTAFVAADITFVELTPDDVGSGASDRFDVFPTFSPQTFLPGFDAADYRTVNFNTAPDGQLTEGGDVNTQYASLGVVMNDIRLSANIYGGNNYGAGFATEDNGAQIFTFTVPVIAVGIVNTSPDHDLVQFWSGANGTGTLLGEFNDQEGQGINFNIDRFVGGISDGQRIGSLVVLNQSGDLELDELIFVVPAPSSGVGLALIGVGALRRRRV